MLQLVLLIVLIWGSACNSESDRVFDEATKCATVITNGGDCSAAPNKSGAAVNSAPNTGSPQETSANAKPDGPIEQSRVYLDATASMQGFVATPDSTFTKLIEALSYAMPGSRLYKYGTLSNQKAGAVPESFAREIRFSQELRRPGFYDLDYNEDDVLFNYLAAEDRPVRSVLVTDGVYSARQSELESEVVQAISKWLSRGRFFGVLIFNGPFKGKLYSENRRGWLEGINVGARPFYVFVFSPTEKGFRELKDQLAGEFKDMQALVFPRQAVSCPLVPTVKQGLERKVAPPDSPFYLHMYNEHLFESMNSAELTYDLRCVPVNDYPVAELNVEVSLDSYAWLQNSFKKAERAPQFEFTYDAGAGRAANAGSPAVHPTTAASPAPTGTPSPRLKLVLQKDLSTAYTLYHVRFGVSAKSLRPNIRSLATEDDSDPAAAEKTYRFFEFISALATVHLQNKTSIKLPEPVFVALKNR